MSHETKPLVRTLFLILGGGCAIMLVTYLGISSDAGLLIKEDVVLGPIIAATKILVPLFMTIGLVYYLSTVRVCKDCGKVLFWKRSETREDHEDHNHVDPADSVQMERSY